MKFSIYSDGGARGNPGPAGIGYVIYDENKKVFYKEGSFIGKKTNNEAEYLAIILAMSKALELGGTILQCYLDSELVVKQLKGEYKVRDPKLAKNYLKVWQLQSKFQSVRYQHIYREKNKVADQLVNEALDREQK